MIKKILLLSVVLCMLPSCDYFKNKCSGDTEGHTEGHTERQSKKHTKGHSEVDTKTKGSKTTNNILVAMAGATEGVTESEGTGQTEGKTEMEGDTEDSIE